MPSGDLFRPAIADLVPYEPGKPVEEVQRELGLERVVKLASNEGQFGPFPAAIEAVDLDRRVVRRHARQQLSLDRMVTAYELLYDRLRSGATWEAGQPA